MQVYNVGIILIMIKLVQYLIEVLFEVEFHPMLSVILMGLFGSGVTLIIIDLVATGVTPWLSIPLIIIILVTLACLMKIEIQNLINYRNKDE